MKSIAKIVAFAAWSIVGIVGCSGDATDDKSKSTTVPFREESGRPKTPPPAESKSEPKPGFQ